MLKNILKLDGAQQLSKNEQKEISGGLPEGCISQTWSGSSLNNCKLTRPGGHYYNYSAGKCTASFCPRIEIGL